ncbi:MAG: hypothetical protein LBL34_01045 [Clostridiales bacterium]|jgi:hypothetical protein|nr:hypothetical protein [Clostridiales bacterium]
MTLQEVINDIRARCPNAFSDMRLLNWANDCIEEIWEDVAYDGVWTKTLIGGQREYALPGIVDFTGIYAVYVDDVKYAGKPLPEYGISNIYFKAEEGVIALNPVPDKSGGLMRIYHIMHPPHTSTFELELPIRERCIELIKTGVMCTVAKAMGDVPLANNYAADYNAALAEIRGRRPLYDAAYPKVQVHQ